MVNILFLNYTKNDACAFYRSSGIARSLEKLSGYSITVAQWNEINLDWSMISNYDVIMMQRPFTGQSLDLIRFIKMFPRIRLWFDFDDNLLALPPENEAFQLYNENKENIKQIIGLADVISVTTEDLKQSYLPFNSNIHIIPNAFNDSIFHRPELKPREKIVIWRGTKTHIYDLMSNGQAINQACEQFADWQFMFLGYYPWFLSETQNKGFLKGSDIILYFNTLFKMNPAVMQVPLHDNLFNRCKSNIAFIEGVFAGAVSVVPYWWNIPGALPYSNPNEYYEAMSFILRGEVNIESQNRKSWEYIQDCLTLSKVNKLRVELIKSIL
jgi:hypothetical protein